MHGYSSHSKKTPLLCAAEAGHDEIVAYLLRFRKVQADLKGEQGNVQSAKVSWSLQYLYCIIDYKLMFVLLCFVCSFPGEHS